MNPWIPKFGVLRISRYFSWSKIGRFGIRDRWKYMMNSYINWVFNSSSQLALLPVPLMPMSMFEDKAMTGYRSIIFRKSYCIHTFKKPIFEKKRTSFSCICFSSAPINGIAQSYDIKLSPRTTCEFEILKALEIFKPFSVEN